ncbi:MAG: hypothetical protein CML17_11855 [Pusillimonas sp.]|nr:hypothetical protein [Pusillimonas sp.]
MKTIRLTLLSLTLLLVTACSILPEPTPQRVYQLPDQITTAGQSKQPGATKLSLRVSTPSSPLILSSNRVLVMSEPNQLAAFKGVRWSDPMPQLFQARLVHYLRDANNWRVVSTDDTPISSDYELVIRLAQFHAVRMPAHAPGVQITVNATLVNRNNKKAVSSQTFSELAPANSSTFTDLLHAYGTAANTVSANINTWAKAQVEGY